MPGRQFLALLPVAIAAFDFCTDALFAAELFATGAVPLGAAASGVIALTVLANFAICLWLLKFLHDSDARASEGSMVGLQTFTEWTLREGVDAALGCYCFLGLFTIEALHIASSRMFDGAAFSAPLTRFQKRTITALSLVNNVLEDVPQLAIVLYATLQRGSWGAVAVTSFAISAVSLCYTVCLRSSSIMMLFIELSDRQRKAGAKLADERGPASADTPPRPPRALNDAHAAAHTAASDGHMIRQLSSFDHDSDDENADAAARNKRATSQRGGRAPHTDANADVDVDADADADADADHDADVGAGSGANTDAADENAHVKAAYREGLARLAQRRFQDANAWLDSAANPNAMTTSNANTDRRNTERTSVANL